MKHSQLFPRQTISQRNIALTIYYTLKVAPIQAHLYEKNQQFIIFKKYTYIFKHTSLHSHVQNAEFISQWQFCHLMSFKNRCFNELNKFIFNEVRPKNKEIKKKVKNLLNK